MTITQAKTLVNTWPEPYRSGALANIRDAEQDIVWWPGFYGEVMADMTKAIREWERMKNEDEEHA